ncbi:MAG: D-arabinono-1,4-lactone oxidase [bacterium]
MFQNWAQNHRCEPTQRAQIASVDDAVALVDRARHQHLPIRCVGAGHSWSDVACTSGILASTDGLSDVLDIDTTSGLVRVQGGARLKDLNVALAKAGLGFSVLGSISEQSIAGATSTGTHGSGITFGNLATAIRGMKIVTGTGELLELTADDPRLAGAALALGALGIITEITFQAEPAFLLEETRWSLSFSDAVRQMDTIVGEHEHVKFWWLPHTDQVAVFAANRTTKRPSPPSALATRLDTLANDYAFTAILGLGQRVPAVVPSLNRALNAVYFKEGTTVDRSDRVFNLAMPPRHQEAEFGIPAVHAAEFLDLTRSTIERLKLKVNFIQEVRFVAEDDLWLSNAHGRSSCQFGAYCGDSVHAQPFFDAIETLADGFDARPHWGKQFNATRDTLAPRYPRWTDFEALRNVCDPEGIFANGFVRRLFDVVD